MAWLKALIIILTLCFVPSVAAATCRDAVGGLYVFPHAGVKENGHPFSALAFFTVKPGGTAMTDTFDVQATINERGVGVYDLTLLGRPFGWLNGCAAWWDRAGFVGYVSDDGESISYVTLDGEQMAGTALRIRR